MSSNSQESGCQRIQSLRNRLKKIQSHRDSAEASHFPEKRRPFQEEWCEGWKSIQSLFAEIDRLLSRSTMQEWNSANPAILQFPPSR